MCCCCMWPTLLLKTFSVKRFWIKCDLKYFLFSPRHFPTYAHRTLYYFSFLLSLINFQNFFFFLFIFWLSVFIYLTYNSFCLFYRFLFLFATISRTKKKKKKKKWNIQTNATHIFVHNTLYNSSILFSFQKLSFFFRRRRKTFSYNIVILHISAT